MESNLPPLPPSDEDALQLNKFDHYYKRRAGEFWDQNEIIRIDDTPPKKCDHEFTYFQGGVKCKKCHIGLIGPLEIRNGKPFYQGEPIPGL